jgi:capsular exopolysaccharide synthesis family protein
MTSNQTQRWPREQAGMSQIFDALQRAESENSGVDISALSEATELLERAERRAASNWIETALHEKDEVASKSGPATEIASHPKTASPAETLLKVDVASNAEFDVFASFHSTTVSLSPKSRVVCVTNPDGAASEAFRLLAVRLRNLRRGRPLKRLLITSAMPQEGKSMVAANLACSFAIASKEKILLVEGDVRRPSLSKTFSMPDDSGLCQCLRDGASLASSIFRLEGAGIWLLPAGSSVSNPVALLQSKKLTAVMEKLATWFDWIVIDTPPVLPLADTSIWARMTDGVLLVTRRGTTEKGHLKRGLEALEPQKLVGVLVNSSNALSGSDYYYGSPSADSAEEPEHPSE